MLLTKYLLNHIEVLLRLSHDVRDREVSAKLREMAGEIRIMVSVADVTNFAATLNQNIVPPTPDLVGAGADSGRRVKPKRKMKKPPVK